MGYVRTGQLELPVGVEAARAALDEAVAAHPSATLRRASEEGVDVVGHVRDHRGEERVRLSVHDGAGGTCVVEHGHWGLRGVGSAELHQLVVDDLLERVRAAVARGLVAGTPGATAAYVGTVLGGEQLDVGTGRSVAVVFGATALTIRCGDLRHDLRAADLLEVEAVPTTTPDMPWDRRLLPRPGGRPVVDTVVGIAAHSGLECSVHVTGSTTSVVNAELAPLRAPARPAPVPSGGALVRVMAGLAQRHRDGVLDDDQFALAKAELLGTARA